MILGAFFYNHKSNPSGTDNVAAIVESGSFDACNGHADPQNRYHYHMVKYSYQTHSKTGSFHALCMIARQIDKDLKLYTHTRLTLI